VTKIGTLKNWRFGKKGLGLKEDPDAQEEDKERGGGKGTWRARETVWESANASLTKNNQNRVASGPRPKKIYNDLEKESSRTECNAVQIRSTA